jgi:hypothetical protein
MRRSASAAAAALCLGVAGLAAADFVYVDFNETQGLSLNGAASTTACGEVEGRYG